MLCCCGVTLFSNINEILLDDIGNEISDFFSARCASII